MRRFSAIALTALMLTACTSAVERTLEIAPTPEPDQQQARQQDQQQAALPKPKPAADARLPYGDTDPHDWKSDAKGRQPWDYPVHGIDVSKYQATINWREAKRGGIAFAFIKATEGGDRLDDRFLENWAKARRANMPRGAYHFLYLCGPGDDQARWFIKHVPREAGALPPVLDAEWNHTSPSCKRRPPADEVRREMQTFMTIVEQHYGKPPIIYTTVDFFKDNELWRFSRNQFWLRSVAAHPGAIYPDQPWSFWQYTGTGVVPGIKGNTDINVFSGTRAKWNEWLAKHAR